MKSITSLTNDKIKYVASLAHKKYRDIHQAFVAEGLRTCQTLIESGMTLQDMMVTEQHYAAAARMVPESSITLVSELVMRKISSSSTPSGILSIFAIPQPPKTLTPGIVLANISDPGNMGTLIRTTAAMNVKTVVCIEGTDPYSPKAVQASAGALGSVHIHKLSWQELIQQKGSLSLCALVVSDGQSLSAIHNKNMLVVIGSEAHGIPTEWLADCTQKVTIEMPGKTESLNAAVAGSIALYVIFNQ